MNVKIKKLHTEAIIPTQGSAEAAGLDLYACLDCEEIIIQPHETVKINTGLAIQPPEGYFGAIVARSGIATKLGLRPANAIGIADYDYKGEYIVALHNDSDCTRTIANHDRIAQLVFLPYIHCEIEEVDDIGESERGNGGFGSTGK